MKAKNIIALLGLSFGLGIGVFAGLAKSKPIKADAAPVSTVYCKMTQSWWKADGAAVGAYCWNSKDDNQKNAAWPGVRMSAVDGQTDLWTYSVPNGYDKIIFTRVNGGTGSVADWGAKTVDLDIPSKKNCFTITSETAVWGDPGATGYWSVYPEVAPEYHLLGSFNSWNDLNDDYLFVVDGSDSNHYTLSDVVLATTDEFKVADPNNDDWFDNGAGNIKVGEAGTYDIDFYVTSDNPTHVVLHKQVVEPVYTVKCGSVTATFELDETDKPEGVLHQYSATFADYAYRAKELKFYADETQITSNIGVDAGDAEHINNVYGNTTDGFRVRHYTGGSMKIYLKTYAGGGYSIWGLGYESEYFYAAIRNTSGNYQDIHLELDTSYEANETYIQQYKSSSPVSIKAESGADFDSSFSFTDNGGVTEHFVPEEVAGNNAMTAFQSTCYKVHNDCLETIYVKLRATDLKGVLYIGGYRDAHQITIGGNTITLGNYKSDTNEYYATGVSLTAGDQVTAYTVNGEAVEGYAAKAVANNNLNKAMEVVATTASADIYYNVSAKTLWISGVPNSGFAVYKNSNTVVAMVETDPFGDYLQWKTESTSFAVGDTIQVMNCGSYDSTNGGPTIWSITKINEGGNGDKFEVDGGVIKCKTACSTSVYLKLLNENDEIYFGSVAEYIEDAIQYVEGFKSAMSTACSASAATKQSAVESAWAAQATEFAKLTKEAQDEVKLGGYSSVAEVQEFGSRYVAILEQHGSWSLANFLEWDVNLSNMVSPRIETDNSLLIGIVTVISLASVSTLGVLLIIKKRRVNN